MPARGLSSRKYIGVLRVCVLLCLRVLHVCVYIDLGYVLKWEAHLEMTMTIQNPPGNNGNNSNHAEPTRNKNPPSRAHPEMTTTI